MNRYGDPDERDEFYQAWVEYMADRAPDDGEPEDNIPEAVMDRIPEPEEEYEHEHGMAPSH